VRKSEFLFAARRAGVLIPTSAVQNIRGTKRNAMKNFLLTCAAAAFLFVISARAASNTSESRLSRPLSIAEALDIALQQNSAILKSKADLKASHGIEVQTRAIALPRVNIGSQYSANERSATDRFRPSNSSSASNALFTRAFEFADQRWSADAKIVQSIYEGGRIHSALKTAKLTREQALLNHQTVIEDVLRDVRVAYFDVLLGEQLIAVQEASVKLLEQELSETRKRYEAGTVPQFNVLRAEVELANERPRLIRARNVYRIGKDTLATLLGETVPRNVEEVRLQLTDTLDARPVEFKLSDALNRAFEERTELAALRKAVALREQQVVDAHAGYKPSVQVFAGYGAKSSQFSRDLTDELHGWEAGAQLNWNIFDGFLTQGRIEQTEALRDRAREDVTDVTRRIELEVRTAWSSFVEAREVLESQKKVQEQAQESLRLANARAAAGTATQLDVLNAQTALTEARSTQAQALHDYAVARARLERAIGQSFSPRNQKAQ
jgi:outer membrane protein TolC